MWEMLEPELDCGDECGGPGPPPEFLIPPPPRPAFLHEIIKCSEDPLPDIEMCDAIPILDASYHSSPSLQTSAMIILCSVLLVLVVLISSLLVWKHKRKVQNFLPCKTPTRGVHLDTSGVSGHSVTYEDPDAHLGHRPLVMRHHHNIEMLHPKSIHFPSGYPMTRSPPLFVCSSPGPDPYRSHDNVYEELGPRRDSDIDSEPALNSDDDFAEDELSLPGERLFPKLSPDTATIATIYHERSNVTNLVGVNSGGGSLCGDGGSSNISGGIISGGISSSGSGLERTLNERNSLLSSSSSTDNNRCIVNGLNVGNNLIRNSSPDRIFRTRKICTRDNNRKLSNYSVDDLNTSSSDHNNPSDIVQTIYDERNMMTLPYSHSTQLNNNNNNINNNINNSNNNSLINNNNNNNLNNNNLRNITLTGDSEVDRRNHINNQLLNNSVSTIYRDRNNQQQQQRGTLQHQQQNNYHNNHLQQQHYQNNRSRTNPRTLDRRRHQRIEDDPSYAYTEPVFHEGILYDACLQHAINERNPVYHPYILPEFTTFRTLNNASSSQQQQQQQQQNQLQPPSTQIYSRDSSFGSDSGFSGHTQTSNRGGGGGGSLGLSGSSSFGWGRRSKDNNKNKNGTFDGS